jgi:hypothetical protein
VEKLITYIKESQNNKINKYDLTKLLSGTGNIKIENITINK